VTRLRAILFDAGGTLVFPDFHRIAAELTVDGCPVDPGTLASVEPRVRFALDRAETVRTTVDEDRWQRYMEDLCRAVGLAEAPRAALERLRRHHASRNLWEHVPPDVPAALEALGRSYRLGVVSNANGTVRALLSRLGLAQRFEQIVDSGEEGVEKPDPRLFSIALARMGLRADETAYVGDMFHLDVLGARAAGLYAVLLDPHDLHAGAPVARVRWLADLAGVLAPSEP
jgi:putative hydrolase of the HAD superfamily